MKKAYIGIDSHKEQNTVAVALAGRGDPELYGKAPADLDAFERVLRRILAKYGLAKEDVAAAIRALLDAGNVALNRPAVEAGLALLEAGGDFADGIMAHEGRWLGGETFVSFDRKAVKLLSEQGEAAQLLSQP